MLRIIGESAAQRRGRLLWGWLENIVLAGVKIVPLGQSSARDYRGTYPPIPVMVKRGLELSDEHGQAALPKHSPAASTKPSTRVSTDPDSENI